MTNWDGAMNDNRYKIVIMKYLLTWIFLLCTAVAMAQSNYDERTGLNLFNKESYSQALPYLQRAAKSGSLDALTCLGQMYERGLGVEKSSTIMLNMYNKAIQGGFVPAMMHLAEHYYHSSDVQKALELWKQAADKGCNKALFFIGECYELGNGVKMDWDKADEYYLEGSIDDAFRCYLARVSIKRGNFKTAYSQYMHAHDHNALTDFALEPFVDILCCDTSHVYRNIYEKDIAMIQRIGGDATLYFKNARRDNVMKAEEILSAYKNRYPNEVETVMNKYGAQLYSAQSANEERRKTAQKEEKARQYKASKYNDLMQSSVTVDLEQSGTDFIGNKKKTLMNIPYQKKKLVKISDIFSGSFSVSFFMKSKSNDIQYRGGKIFYKSLSNDVNSLFYPLVCIEGGFLVLKTGKASYQSHPFKQFSNAAKVLFDGNWHHFSLTVDKELKKASIYVDGNWKGNEFIGSDDVSLSTALVFCSDCGDLKISDLSLFKNKVLSGGDIDLLYKQK